MEEHGLVEQLTGLVAVRLVRRKERSFSERVEDQLPLEVGQRREDAEHEAAGHGWWWASSPTSSRSGASSARGGCSSWRADDCRGLLGRVGGRARRAIAASGRRRGPAPRFSSSVFLPHFVRRSSRPSVVPVRPLGGRFLSDIRSKRGATLIAACLVRNPDRAVVRCRSMTIRGRETQGRGPDHGRRLAAGLAVVRWRCGTPRRRGPAWGYGGSGPAQLALVILLTDAAAAERFHQRSGASSRRSRRISGCWTPATSRADAGAEARGPGVPSPRERALVAVRSGAFDYGLPGGRVPCLRAGAADSRIGRGRWCAMRATAYQR